MKINKMIILIVILLITSTFYSVVFSSSENIFYTNGQSILTVNYTLLEGKTYVIIVTKDEDYTYYFMTSGSYTLPLQFGCGVYDINLYEKDTNGKYRKLFDEKVEVEISDNVFLNKTSMINWQSEDALFEHFMSMDVQSVHGYIVENFVYGDSYDQYDFMYTPDVNAIFENKYGKCLDFSVLFAAICRERGIPCKLVYGKTIFNGNLHSWDEIYVDGEWKIVDITLDIQYFGKGWTYEIYKDHRFYIKSDEY